MTLVHELLEATAARLPDKTAVVCGDARATYAQLDTWSGQVADGLQASGVSPGARVVVQLPNSIDTVVAIFAVLKAGAAFIVVSPATNPERLARILRDASPALLVTEQRLAGLLAHAGSRASAPSVSADDVASIIYTSGTTGEPKGVVSLQRDTVFATRSIAAYLANTSDDVIYCPLFLGFSYGLYQLLTAVAVGATLVLDNGVAFPRRSLELIARERVTGLPGVPTIFSLLLRPGNLRGLDLSALRYLTTAAAPMPVAQVETVRAAFPHADLYAMYGQTECKRACYLPPHELDRRPGSVGVAIPGTDAYVVDERGHRVRPNTVGELVVRGPHLMHGYWGRPAETAEKLRLSPETRDVVLHTGDLFRADNEGFLHFVGRSDDIIKCRGEKVSPAEVEAVVCGLPGVEDAGVVGVPDPLLGEAVKVFVVREAGAVVSERDVRAHCTRHLDGVMIPRHVEFCDALPRSDNGKLLRRELRSCAA